MKHNKNSAFALLSTSFMIAVLSIATLFIAACAAGSNDDTPAEQKIELKTPITLVTEAPTSTPEQN